MLPNPQETVDLVTFTGEILNGKLDFLCGDCFLISLPSQDGKGHSRNIIW